MSTEVYLSALQKVRASKKKGEEAALSDRD